MGIQALFTPWRHTRRWFPYERAILTFLADQAGDDAFSGVLLRQLNSVFEIRRKRVRDEYETWPAFLGEIPLFATHKTVQTAMIEASCGTGKARVRVLLGGGMVAKILIGGDGLPKPPGIELRGLRLKQFDLPTAPVLPEAQGWVADLIREGNLKRLDPPLAKERRMMCLMSLPPLPAGYVEYCEQSEGGVVAPESEQFDILGLEDVSICSLPDGRTFVPLVSMREFGGLAALAGETAVFLVDGNIVELYALTFEEALRKLADEYGAA